VYDNRTLLYFGGDFGSGETDALWAVDLTMPTQQTLLSSVDDTLSKVDERILYGAAAYNTSWYIFGGASEATGIARQDIAVLNLVTMQWAPLPTFGDIPSPRFASTFSTLDALGNSLLIFCVLLPTHDHVVTRMSVCGAGVGIVFGGAATDYAADYNDTYALDFQTLVWKQVNTAGQGPAIRDSHSAVVWGNVLVIFGGEDCCTNFADLYILDFDQSTPTWSSPAVTFTDNQVLLGRFGHTASLYGNIMWVYGGEGVVDYPELWSLDLLQWTWTFVVPSSSPSSAPPSLTFHASVMLGAQMYVFGGQNQAGQPQSSTYVYSVNDNTWTPIKTLDSASAVPQPVAEFQGVASPFNDQLIVWGPGSSLFQTQFFVSGYHQITVSEAQGSDVACQLNESDPCRTFAFALSRFAGASDENGFTVSADMRNSFTIGSSQTVNSISLAVPVLIQGTVPGIVLDCQQTRCFTVTNVLSNSFSLVNVVLVNAYAVQGGAIMAVNSLVSLQHVTITGGRATLYGGAIYLQGSSLTMSDAQLVNNTALISGTDSYTHLLFTLVSLMVKMELMCIVSIHMQVGQSLLKAVRRYQRLSIVHSLKTARAKWAGPF
jgi:hypothetical protein